MRCFAELGPLCWQTKQNFIVYWIAIVAIAAGCAWAIREKRRFRRQVRELLGEEEAQRFFARRGGR